jgi:O-succinylbenzoic acid--CoA ligase
MGARALKWQELKTRRWFFSPRLEGWQKKILRDLRARAPRDPEMLWVLSSGTQSVRTVKAIGLSEGSILLAADSVNRHLHSTRADRWLAAIPDYHIGGLSIYARAHLSGAAVVKFQPRWSPHEFCDTLVRERISLTSLVPTQLHDLVSAGLKAPSGLRAVIIGGGALEPWLYLQARSCGWPVLPSYGLTECCSQVATASLDTLKKDEYPALKVLSHIRMEMREQRVFLRSEAVCRWIACGRAGGEFTLETPLRDGWLPTEDIAEWQDGGRHGHSREWNELRIIGRRDSVVKILGVLVPVQEVEFEAGEFFRLKEWREPFTILPIPHARNGTRLLLVTDSAQDLRIWRDHIDAFNATVPGVRRLAGPCWLPKIACGDLGKVKRAELTALIQGGG